MSPKEFEETIKDAKYDLEIAIATMDYLEKKENRKFIINQALSKLMKESQGTKQYQYQLENSKKLKEFKSVIKEHFKYIIRHCDKPRKTNFMEYKGEIKFLDAYCDFYTHAINIVNKKLNKKQLIRDNIKAYLEEIKKNLHCSD